MRRPRWSLVAGVVSLGIAACGGSTSEPARTDRTRAESAHPAPREVEPTQAQEAEASPRRVSPATSGTEATDRGPRRGARPTVPPPPVEPPNF